MSETEKEYKTPEWYDESKLTKIYFGDGERGWAIDLGDGKYRLANQPIAAMFGDPDSPRWGDLVEQVGNRELRVIERYNPEDDLINE